MKDLKLIALFLIALLAYACQDAGIDPIADDIALIQAIQNASNKQTVNEGALPAGAQSSLGEEYTESYTAQVNEAEGLGYEVTMRRSAGAQAGEASMAYFNTDGRRLRDGKRPRGPKGDRDERGCERPECFQLVFPVTFLMADGTAITVSSNDREGWAPIKAWYGENPDTKERPNLQFPVQIELEAGEIVNIDSREALEGALAYCRDQGDRDRCFELVFPVTFTMPDGSEIAVTSKDKAGWAAVKAWYGQHPDAKERPRLQFPVEIAFNDGTVATVNGPEDMQAAKERCAAAEE